MLRILRCLGLRVLLKDGGLRCVAAWEDDPLGEVRSRRHLGDTGLPEELSMSSSPPLSRRIAITAECWGLRRIDGLAMRYGRTRRQPRHLLVGEHGEREALFALRQRGYIVVATRWQSSKVRGDIDLIAWDGDWLCFLEVKTRTRRDPLDPAESAVDRDKEKQLRKLARAYLRGFPESGRDAIRVRFDVIAVYMEGKSPEVEVMRDAFAWR